ncbi:MAG: class I SAM-dependent methyltransferase [Candidatus Scalinduaceae bacterium]
MKEEEIRKRDVFNKYIELVEKDVKDFFEFSSFLETNCPACGSSNFIIEFEKLSFKYVSCKTCSTLFVNPRPPLAVLKKFYSKSPSTSFWVNEFFKPVAEVRREKVFKPRAEYISKVIDTNKKLVIGDIGAGFGLFLEEMKKMLPDNHYIAIEPSDDMAFICIEKGLETKCIYLEDLDTSKIGFDLLTIFELSEHLFEPISFFKKAYSLLKPEGCLFLTTLNGKGFDITLLWEKSKSIAPPQHLNFFNPTSIKYLLERVGFEIVEISTPGMLDWDIVEGMIKNEGVKQGRFWDLLAEEGSEKCKRELQGWISKNNLSSHMRVVARKL